MAERRMFAKTIIDSDAFIDMPVTARLLYYDLSMRADDDGFVNSPKKIMRMIGASQDDLAILITKKFLIPFESGVVVIKHWKIHNYLRNDRYKPTTYQDELSQLELDENKAYRLPVSKMDTNGIPTVSKMDTQVRLGKDRLGKVSKENKYIVGNSEEKNEKNTEKNQVEEIISYLNSRLGTRYTTKNKSTTEKIRARMKEGHTVEDFKTVIDKKCVEWMGTEQEKYLRPETLFAAGHFESYLNQLSVKKPESKKGDDLPF